MRIEEIDCWIEVDGSNLDEYGVEPCEEEKKCIAWIPSQVGQKISIRWRDPTRTRDTVGYVAIDGSGCEGIVLDRSRVVDEITYDRVPTTETEYRDLQFGELALTDDDTYLQRDQRSVGEITVTVWECRLAGYDNFAPVSAAPEPSQAHERANKALAHSVEFGEIEEDGPAVFSAEIVDIGAEPLASFTFRYRSLDMLRANGIAPRSTTPASPGYSRSRSSSSASANDRPSKRPKREDSETLPSEPEDVKPNVVDLDEIDQAEERLRQAEDELRRARLEMHRRRGNQRIKLEDVTTFVPGEVVDLTDD
ncbi:hypothetical protein BD626DRAFT_430368 [Schizophyllum amplum]|uniref:DUF7918 domain-containing protein n=1 Tax=Schizophyllum amplum TaxID=97359 RepID=A0A550CIA8_9AGAR|nr:hypothetical protein BD626DRAFT_430368 [Auriculariopsis ampla]